MFLGLKHVFFTAGWIFWKGSVLKTKTKSAKQRASESKEVLDNIKSFFKKKKKMCDFFFCA